MPNSDRIAEVLKAVEKAWRHYPEWRLGQLVENVAVWAGQSVGEIEDDQLSSEIRGHLERRFGDLPNDAESPNLGR